jgi:hypothetical protein
VDELDDETPRAVDRHGGDVETDRTGRPSCPPVMGEPLGRQPSQPSLLGRCHRLLGAAEGRLRPGLHLAEDDVTTGVDDDQIDLTQRAAPVAGHGLVTGACVALRRRFLAPASEITATVGGAIVAGGSRGQAGSVPGGCDTRTEETSGVAFG